MVVPQLPLQRPDVPHVYGKHGVGVGVTQWPAPSQFDWGVDIVVPPPQVGSLHLSPAP